MGRPTDYSTEVTGIICDRLADGESLRSICIDEALPHMSTVCRWLRIHAEFREQYALAREGQADALFDEMLDIADDGSNDWMEKRDADGNNIGWRENGEALQRSKLRVDTRKWMAGKLRPKKYGDKTILGGDPDNPIVTKDVTDTELARLIVFQLTKASRAD